MQTHALHLFTSGVVSCIRKRTPYKTWFEQQSFLMLRTFYFEMLLRLSLLSLSVHQVCALTNLGESPYALNINGNDIYRFVDTTISKRSIPVAINAILKSAVMKSSTATTKVFCKSGNYKDALKDFKKLKPSNVSRRKNITKGYVGYKMVEVVRNKNGPAAVTRIFDVYERKGILLESSENVIVISYVKYPNKY